MTTGRPNRRDPALRRSAALYEWMMRGPHMLTQERGHLVHLQRWHVRCSGGAMASRLWPVFAIASLALLAVVSCCSCALSHERDVDAARRTDSPTGCTGSASFACVYCGGDVGAMAVCDGREWVCPPGTMAPERCPPTCGGPPPRGDCTCDVSTARPRWDCPAEECGPDVAGRPCAVEGETCGACFPCALEPAFGPFACTGGTWSPLDCESCPEAERQPCPALPTIGAECPNEGQICGDGCCDTETICRGGVWEPGAPSDCPACLSYACGEGRCRPDEACAMLGCPSSFELPRTCLPIPEGCAGCDCLELPAGRSCEERGGHVYVDDECG